MLEKGQPFCKSGFPLGRPVCERPCRWPIQTV